MTNPQLLEYVRQQLAAGVSKDNIKKTLATQGWNEQDVNEAFSLIEAKAPAPTVPSQSQTPAASATQTQSAPTSFADFGSLFSNAFAIYKKQWLPLLLISAIIAAISYALAFFLLGGAILGIALISVVNPLILIGAVFAGLLVFSYLMVVLGGVMLRAVSDTNQGVGASFDWAFKHSLSLSWIYILFFLLIAGGFSLVIIPGIFFLIWFAFAPFVYATEGDKGFNAYFKSKDYVKGHFWSFVLRLIPPALIFGVIYILPVDQLIKSVLYFLLNPFLLAYMQSLYLSAKAVRAQSTATPQKESKIAYLAVGLIGLALPAFLLVSLNNARTKTQDIGKLLALSSLKTSIEFYAIDHNAYPDTLDEVAGDSSNYTYTLSADKKSYTLCIVGSTDPNACVQSDGLDSYAIATSTIGAEPYSDTHGFSIQFPKGWELSTGAGLGDVTDAMAGDTKNAYPSGGMPNIQIDVTPFSSLQEITTQEKARILSIWKPTSFIQDKDTTLAGQPAHVFEYEWASSEDGSTQHTIEYDIFYSGKKFAVYATASKESWNKEISIFTTSINSFSFTK